MTLHNRQRIVIIALYVSAILLSAGVGCLLWMSPTGTQQSGDHNLSASTQP
jgi:hypothetical protein